MRKDVEKLLELVSVEFEELKVALLNSSPEKILESAAQYERYQRILEWLVEKGDELLTGEQIDLLVRNGDVLGAISLRITTDLSEYGISYAVGQEIEDLQETEAEETKSYSDLLWEEVSKELAEKESYLEGLTARQVMDLHCWDWIEAQDIAAIFEFDEISEEDARLLLDKGNIIGEIQGIFENRDTTIMGELRDCLSDLLYDLRKEARNG